MARPPSAGKPRFRDGEGSGPGPFLRHWPPGGRCRGRSGSTGKRREIFLGALKEVLGGRRLSAAVLGGRPGHGVVSAGGSSRARRPASQRAGTAEPTGGRRGDPGAGRWAALAAAGPAARGAALEAAPSAAGEAEGRRAAGLGR